MGLIKETEHSYYSGNDFGGYQFISLKHVINNFMISYVGNDKIISKIKRTDVLFHAQRALQELSYDTLKSIKAQEIDVPPSLTMMLPQDYVNYVKLSWSDASGIEHVLYPASKTSNPTPILQNSDGEYALTAEATLAIGSAQVTLDAEYKDILIGMKVYAPSIPEDTFVMATSTTGSVTTINLDDGSGTPITPTYTGTETLTFVPSDGSIPLEKEIIYVLENLSWSITDNKITQSPNTDVENIDVGMLVSHDFFPEGTTVTSVNGAIITVSNESTSAGTGANITFVSKNIISSTWKNYSSTTPSENQENYDDDYYVDIVGQRYGIDPQHAQSNGSFFIDELTGKIHFSSNISGKNIILKYISDGLGTDEEMIVHKFAEEAMYKHIAYAILATRINVPEHLVIRFRKEKFAAKRVAKLRLSNLKMEELTQVLRGKSKHIKH